MNNVAVLPGSGVQADKRCESMVVIDGIYAQDPGGECI